MTDVATQQRDADAIRNYAPIAEELATHYQHPLYLGIVERARGVAHRLDGEYEQAASRLEQARTIFETLGTRWQMGRTLVECGELEAARHNQTGAREYFERARAEFEAMRAQPNAEAVRLRLVELDEL